MQELSTETRLKIYEKTLSSFNKDFLEYKKNQREFIRWGLCFYLMETCQNLTGEFLNCNQRNYPELFLQKPSFGNWNDSGYWWNNRDFETRIKVLKKCIELCKKTKQKPQ